MSTADPAERGLVFLVDDDPSIRSGIDSLLRSMQLDVRCFASAAEFQSAPRPDRPACLVLDIRMPGRSGLEVQRDLSDGGDDIPIIFLTAHGDIPMSVRAMKGGAVEFLTKPVSDQDFLDAIHAALAVARERRAGAAAIGDLRARYQALTPREQEIMAKVVAGRLNKQIAADLGVSEITIKVSRGQLMRKMQAGSLADLVRIAERLRT
jgi:FixJ family two-component response regulator